MEIKCPKCEIICEPYQDYSTIFKCPECGDLRTTVNGDQVEAFRFKVKNEM